MSDHFPAHAWALSGQTCVTYPEPGGWQDWAGKTHVVQRSPLEIHTFLKLPQSLRRSKPGCSSILLWISCAVTFRKCCSGRGAGGEEREEEPLQYQQHCWDSIIVLWHWPHSPTPLTLTSIQFPSSGSWWKEGSLSFSCHVTKTPLRAWLCTALWCWKQPGSQKCRSHKTKQTKTACQATTYPAAAG